jgi:UDP-N-acetylglucosamine acyltransferase
MQERFRIKTLDLNSEVHPTAVIHPFAKLGDGIKVGPYSIIGEHVELGNGCVVGSHVLIEGHTMIGRNNTFHHGASIGGDPQDLKYEGQKTYLEIGDGNTFREFFTANRGSGNGGKTKIGSRCFLMAYAHIAHDCTIGDGVTIANSVHLAGHVRIDDYATVGGVTPVHQFVSIGKYAFVGGGSRVEKDIPPFIKAAGNPTRVYGINGIGLERHGFSSEKRAMIKRMFNVLYRSDLNVSQVLEQLRSGDYEDPERRVIVDFLESSQRGITKL